MYIKGKYSKISFSVLRFYVPVNSYAHVETVSSPNLTFFLGKLDIVVNLYFVYILLLVTIKNSSWRKMTIEMISGSISTKVWDRAGITLLIPGSAVRLDTDCATGPVIQFLDKIRFLPVCFSDKHFVSSMHTDDKNSVLR